MSSFTSDLLYNVTTEHLVHNATVGCGAGRPSKMFGLAVKVVYAIGIIGNAVAIITLRRGERRVRNRKHLLLLTSLAANDLVALVSTMHYNLTDCIVLSVLNTSFSTASAMLSVIN